MGFGPKARDIASGVDAVKQIVALLYPERSTDQALAMLSALAEVLLTAQVPLSFEHMARFLRDPAYRHWALQRLPEPLDGFWTLYAGRAVPEQALDPDFAWLLADRLQTAREQAGLADLPPGP
ncbi:MAG: hypothetical protein M0Z53_10130 [Thermaerobacter sp.]|nr:hypothetical protein [Thermaerobacter sp.]